MATGRTILGSGLLLVGCLGLAYLAVSLPVLPLSGCTAVGYAGEPPGGFALETVEQGRIFYTPDGGVNQCSTSVLTVGVPLGAALVGAALLVGADRGLALPFGT
jgi:hypothetical protein